MEEAIIYLVIALVASIVTIALQPRPEVPKPATLEDFDVPSAEEGKPIPVVFGTVYIRGPNVLWYGDLRSVAFRKKGGKK